MGEMEAEQTTDAPAIDLPSDVDQLLAERDRHFAAMEAHAEAVMGIDTKLAELKERINSVFVARPPARKPRADTGVPRPHRRKKAADGEVLLSQDERAKLAPFVLAGAPAGE